MFVDGDDWVEYNFCETPYINGWITAEKLKESAKLYGKSPYGEHLKAVAEGKVRY